MMIPEREDDPYIAWRPPFPEPEIRAGTTALLIVDMQRHSAHRDGATLRKVRAAGFEEVARGFGERLDLIVPNIRHLQDAFRETGLEVIHVRIASMTADGRDRGPSHKKLGHAAAPASETPKSCLIWRRSATSWCSARPRARSSAPPISSTSYATRHHELVVTGIVTTGCVHTAVTDAADRGFHVIVEDGCGALVPRCTGLDSVLRDVYAKILATSEVLDRV